MGSYAQFMVDDFDLFSTKSGPAPDALMVFREIDKVVSDYEVPEGGDPDEYPEQCVRYSAPASTVRDRLELFGFGLERARSDFEESRAEEIERWQSYASDPFWMQGSQREHLDEQIATLEELTFERWCEVFARALAEKQPRLSRGSPEWDQATPLERHMFSWDTEDLFGFPGFDSRPFLRVVCDLVPPSTQFIYDLTDLVAGGYVEVEEELTEWSLQGDPAFLGNGIIVLTEGKSDQRLLSRSLRLLAPHLAPYFTFVDFEQHKVEGGAGRLVHGLKLFSGARVANRIIAIFDNDTAAASALKSLEGIPFPGNVSVLQYPVLDLARDYPTLGPHGLVNADVNGLAGSLELYFGVDVLTDEGGTLTPVQWRGYDDRLARYQGELVGKGELQKRFEAKLLACEADRSEIVNHDWTAMKLIVESLTKAFHSAVRLDVS